MGANMLKLRIIFIIFLMVALVCFLFVYSKPAPAETVWDDLIIINNLPEVETSFHKGKTRLTAIHLYKDGRVKKAARALTWHSSDRSVAQVSQDGQIRLKGKKGMTKITVTDGTFQDNLVINHGKEKVSVIKEKEPKYHLISQLVKSLTLEEKIGQMLMPDFRQWDGKAVTEVKPEIAQIIQKYHLGGIILFKENIQSIEQTLHLTTGFQSNAEKFGLLLSIDQEGGSIDRLNFGTTMPGNMALGAGNDKRLTELVGKAIGKELSLLGINMDFAPVLDINNNPENPVIGLRSFSSDPETVTKMGTALAKGLDEANIVAAAKHFPGHGNTAVDSHIGLPVVRTKLDELKKMELQPFQQLMDKDIDAVMSAHITYPFIETEKFKSAVSGQEITLPATLSHKILTRLVRDEMGYEGVIITDALNMNAIASHFQPVDSAIRAIKAGVDVLLMPVGVEEVANGLYEAVAKGDITEERINQSVTRILTLKLKHGILKEEEAPSYQKKLEAARSGIHSIEHQQLEKLAAKKGITLVKNNGTLPISQNLYKKIIVIGDDSSDVLAASLEKFHSNITAFRLENKSDGFEECKEADLIIISVSNNKKLSEDYIDLGENRDVPVVFISVGTPYAITALPSADSVIAQFGQTKASYQATAEALFGGFNPSGRLPVAIPDKNGHVLYHFREGLSYD